MDVRAAVATAVGHPLALETVQLEGPRAGEALVEIKATGVCHTDGFTCPGRIPKACSRPSSAMKVRASWSRSAPASPP